MTTYRKRVGATTVGFYTLPAKCAGCGKSRHRVCKLCGKTELAWDTRFNEQTGIWRLMVCADNGNGAGSGTRPANGTVHTCDRDDVARVEKWKRIQRDGTDSDDDDDEPMGPYDGDESAVEEQMARSAGTVYRHIQPFVKADIAEAMPTLDIDVTAIAARAIAAAEAAAREGIATLAPRELKIINQLGESSTVARQHRMFPILLRLLAARCNVFIAGPAGSGKTQSAANVADALKLKFYPKSMGPATTEYSLMGFIDATGTYRPGLLREPFTKGGVALFDEIDSANPAATTSMNTAMANEYCSFPDGVMKKHKDFVLIASGNTFGRGANRMYSGRTQLDAATLNRFFFIEWDFDDALELDIARSMAKGVSADFVPVGGYDPLPPPERFTWAEEGRSPSDTANDIERWVRYVQDVRQSVAKSGVRMVAGTRDVIDGSKAIAAGFTVDAVAHMRFWAPAPEDDANKVKSGMKMGGVF